MRAPSWAGGAPPRALAGLVAPRLGWGRDAWAGGAAPGLGALLLGRRRPCQAEGQGGACAAGEWPPQQAAAPAARARAANKSPAPAPPGTMPRAHVALLLSTTALRYTPPRADVQAAALRWLRAGAGRLGACGAQGHGDGGRHTAVGAPGGRGGCAGQGWARQVGSAGATSGQRGLGERRSGRFQGACVQGAGGRGCHKLRGGRAASRMEAWAGRRAARGHGTSMEHGRGKRVACVTPPRPLAGCGKGGPPCGRGPGRAPSAARSQCARSRCGPWPAAPRAPRARP